MTDIIRAAFDQPAWHELVDALFEATGLSVVIMDAENGGIVATGNRCAYCDATDEGRSSLTGACFDEAPGVAAVGITHALCRGGLPSYLAPIHVGGVHRCNLVVGGFVTSTRERKRLFERLLGRGMGESAARKAVREVPVITKHEVDSFIRMAAVSATQILESELERHLGTRRAVELEQLFRAARELGEHQVFGPHLLAAIVERAAAITSADSCALMLARPGAGLYEVVATVGTQDRYAPEQVVRADEGFLGQVFSTGRGLLISGERDSDRSADGESRDFMSAMFVPLLEGEMVLGMFYLEVNGRDHRLTIDDLRFAEEYAAMAAEAILQGRERQQVERVVREHTSQSRLARELGSAADVEEIAQVAARVLAESLEFAVGGVVVTGWGRDQAAVVLGEEVAQADVDLVLGDASGRDVSRSPFQELLVFGDHRPLEDSVPDDSAEWVTLSTELIVRGTVIGYVFAAARSAGAFDGEDRRLLVAFADHTAAAMERVATLERMRDDLAKTITALSATLDAGEHAERGHSDRVMDYAIAMGEQLGLPAEEIETLRFAGLLHDVGKIGLSEEILLKPSRLNDSETQLVRMHPELGASVVEQIEFLNSITPVILHHHERWDGEGYPMGIAGEDIPLLARILAIADAFDAMTSTRPYRPRLSYSQAKTELMQGAGSQFDPRVVEAFLEAMDRRALAGASGLFAERSSAGPQLPA